jgi:hypothetical protein
MIELVKNTELYVTLDPVQTEGRLPSVAFDIKACFTMPSQQTTIHIKETWFEYSALNVFETGLRDLIERESGTVELRDMSEDPIISIGRNGNDAVFTLIASDTVKMGKVTLEVNGYALEIKEMFDRLQGYPKWW